MKPRFTLTWLHLLLLATTSAAQTHLQVHRGWGGKERSGRWNPITVRASNPEAQDVMLDFRWATGAGFQAIIFQHIAIGPTPSTFELFVPAHYSPVPSVLVLRDTSSEKRIAQSPPRSRPATSGSDVIGPEGIMIGISGQSALLQDVEQNRIATAAYLPPRLLPGIAIGYDCIDVLFLNQPDLGAIDSTTQRAILDWVRAGGSLLMAPADGPIATESALAEALPCRIGAITSIDLSPAILEQAGLASNVLHMSGRELIANPGAKPFDIIPGTHVIAWSGRYGLGQILVSPIELASLRFDPLHVSAKATAFWQPILANLGQTVQPQPRRKYDAPFYGYASESQDQQREGGAMSTLCDFVTANIAPRREVPLALLAILLVIGPVDSIVLYVLGRRHWTWSTIPGWIALLALAAFTGISSFQQSHTEYRAVTVIDQVDDHIVSTARLIGVSSNDRSEQSLIASDFWWQPAIPGTIAPADAHPSLDQQFHQTESRNSVEKLIVEPGRTCYFRGDRIGSGGAVIEASLSLHNQSSGQARLLGTIKNISILGLREVKLRTRFGVINIPLGASGILQPQATVTIDLPATGAPFVPEKWEARYQSFGYYGANHQREPVNESDLWAVAPDLCGRHSLRIEELIGSSENFACIYAQCVLPPAPAALGGNEKPVEGYYQWIRALVALDH